LLIYSFSRKSGAYLQRLYNPGIKMKSTCIILGFSAIFFANTTVFSASLPIIENRHAVEISIGSIGTGIDTKAYLNLRKVIGNAITNSIIDKFVIYGYGIEGGFSGCVEDRPSSAIPSTAFNQFLTQLNAIHPKSGTTYSLHRIKTCPALPVMAIKPATVQVAKFDGSISCGISGKSLAEMQKQLGVIPVYSAKKLSDGLLRIAVCGIETGLFNVYEIAKTDLAKAKALGFTDWSQIKKGF
jgi:hypothetical protein